jgi:ribonuclease P protein component
MATQKVATQKRAWFSQKNEHPGRSGRIKIETCKRTQEINCSVDAGSSLQQVMRKEQHLTNSDQYTLVYNEGSTQADRLLVLKSRPNQLEFARYGFSVSKRVGKAVVRNRVKRVLREILRLTELKPGWDIILIARSPSAQGDYQKIKRSVDNLLSRAHLTA